MKTTPTIRSCAFLLAVLSTAACASTRPNTPPPDATQSQPMTTDTHWKAIIAVYPGRPDQVSEDWSWFFNDIAEAFKEDSQVYVDAVYEGDSPKVTVGKATLDVQAYVAKGQAGYVLAMEGQEPLFVEYAMSAETIEAAKDYFAESDR